MVEPAHLTSIPQRRLQKIAADPVASAKEMKLVYVNSAAEGIIRIRNGNNFIYKYKNKKIKDKKILERIRSLVLPPAWEDVWICFLENGHLQATGKDAMGRKQYKYHSLWNTCRNQTKFYRRAGENIAHH